MKNGFTLIELLAVIVVLAIIALIAVPIVLNIINEYKDSANIRSAELYLNGAQLALARKNLTEELDNVTCDVIRETGYLNCNGIVLEVEMEKATATEGIITFTNGKITSVEGLKINGIVYDMNGEGRLIKSQIYTVTFNSNGGSSVDNVQVKVNKTLEKPVNPIRDGYKFLEWQLNGNTYDFNMPITKNIELKAKWAKAEVYTLERGLSFNSNIKTLAKGSTAGYGDTDLKIKTIGFYSYGQLPSGYTYGELTLLPQKDVSDNGNGKIIAYYDNNGNIYIYSEGEIQYNTDTNYMFAYLEGVESIIIPDNVTLIGNFVFKNCTSLKSITIPSSVTGIGKEAFYNCSSLTSVTFKNDSQLSFLGESAFSNCISLNTIIIPSSVTRINSSAFLGCSSLSSIEIPSSVTSIESYTFKNCSKLAAVIIPSSVKSMGIEIFYGCSSLNSIEIPSGITSIGRNTFYDCKSLTSVTIPSTVTSIGSSTFSGCSSLISIKIPLGVTSIEDYTFKNCKSLTSIELPSNLKNIGASAFDNCSGLNMITIPSSVTSIDSSAFANCSGLTSIELPSSLKKIGSSAFSSCTGLTTLIIPSSVINIDRRAFMDCTNLIEVVFEDSGNWKAYYNLTSSTGSEIPSENLANPSTAATNLKNKYRDYYLQKTVNN